MKTQEKLQLIKKYTLSINATGKDTYIELNLFGLTFVDSIKIDNNQVLSSILITSVDRLLRKNQVKKEELSAILVNPGPGYYTSLRVGLTTANILAFGLNIPIKKNGKKGAKTIKSNQYRSKFINPVLPIYNNPPNITKPKTRLK